MLCTHLVDVNSYDFTKGDIGDTVAIADKVADMTPKQHVKSICSRSGQWAA